MRRSLGGMIDGTPPPPYDILRYSPGIVYNRLRNPCAIIYRCYSICRKVIKNKRKNTLNIVYLLRGEEVGWLETEGKGETKRWREKI